MKRKCQSWTRTHEQATLHFIGILRCVWRDEYERNGIGNIYRFSIYIERDATVADRDGERLRAENRIAWMHIHCSVCNMPLLDFSDVAIFSLHAAMPWRQRQHYLIAFINTCIKTKSFRMKWQFAVRICVSRAPSAPSVPHFHDQYLYKWPTSIARSSEMLNDGSLRMFQQVKHAGHICANMAMSAVKRYCVRDSPSSNANPFPCG